MTVIERNINICFVISTRMKRVLTDELIMKEIYKEAMEL